MLRRSLAAGSLASAAINDHAAPNLKQVFRRCNEGDSPYDLRNRETALILRKPKKEFLKKSFKYNGAIHWNDLSIEAENADSVHSFREL